MGLVVGEILMRVEMIANKKLLPKNGLSLITVELEKRLTPLFPHVKVRVRSGENNQLDIYAKKEQKKIVHDLIEEMFNDADEWLLSS